MLLLSLLLFFSIAAPEPRYLATSYYMHETSSLVENEVRFYMIKDSVYIEYSYISQNTRIERFVVDHRRVQRYGDHYDLSNKNKEYCLVIDNRQKLIILESKKKRSLILSSNKGRYTNQRLITFFLNQQQVK